MLNLDELRERQRELTLYKKLPEYQRQREELVQQMKVRQQFLISSPLGRMDDLFAMVQLRGEVAAYQSFINKIDRDLEDIQADIEIALEEEKEQQDGS